MSAANANNINLPENFQVAIISGGRPKLKQRPTARLLAPLKDAGIKNIAWVVSEKDAPNMRQTSIQSKPIAPNGHTTTPPPTG